MPLHESSFKSQSMRYFAATTATTTTTTSTTNHQIGLDETVDHAGLLLLDDDEPIMQMHTGNIGLDAVEPIEQQQHKRMKNESNNAMKKRHKGALQKKLLNDHGITFSEKLTWITPWKMAVIIHCLQTNQDYTVITTRPAPTPKEIEKQLSRQGIRDTKDARQKARMDTKRNNKNLAKALLLHVMEERGHGVKYPPTDKTEWDALGFRIQELVLDSIVE